MSCDSTSGMSLSFKSRVKLTIETVLHPRLHQLLTVCTIQTQCKWPNCMQSSENNLVSERTCDSEQFRHPNKRVIFKTKERSALQQHSDTLGETWWYPIWIKTWSQTFTPRMSSFGPVWIETIDKAKSTWEVIKLIDYRPGM